MLPGTSSSSISTPFADDLVLIGRRHDELTRGLVVRVIDHRQPVATRLGQFLAKNVRSPCMFSPMRSRGGRAAIANRECEFLSRLDCGGRTTCRRLCEVSECEVIEAGRRLDRPARRTDWTVIPLATESEVRSRLRSAMPVAQNGRSPWSRRDFVRRSLRPSRKT
jgi:hypothetical protein